MSDDKTVGECWQHNQDTRKFVEAVEARHDRDLKEIKDDLKALIERLSNRLPPWVMFLFSSLTLLIGLLAAKVVF